MPRLIPTIGLIGVLKAQGNAAVELIGGFSAGARVPGRASKAFADRHGCADAPDALREPRIRRCNARFAYCAACDWPTDFSP